MSKGFCAYAFPFVVTQNAKIQIMRKSLASLSFTWKTNLLESFRSQRLQSYPYGASQASLQLTTLVSFVVAELPLQS